MKHKQLRRESENSVFYFTLIHNFFSPFLGKLTLLSMLPAFLYGCHDTAGTVTPIMMPSVSKVTLSYDLESIMTLDVFVFRDDIFRKLDCYQRFEDMEEWEGVVVSGSGKRTITAIANSPYGRDDWLKLTSRSYMEGITVSLAEEERENPFMAGEVSVDAEGGGFSVRDRLNLIPFASEIRLNSICCDFKGKAYEGEKISDVRVYLTNVNAECGILEEAGTAPRRIINAGRLREEDMDEFIRPELIMQEISGAIGKSKIYPGIHLWCYQSNHPQETPGTPFTRLVIEGKVSGQTYYWPININRDTDDEPGIWRNRQYVYDIRITRKGSTDPDLPIKTEDITINQEIAEWKEIKEYEVAF